MPGGNSGRTRDFGGVRSTWNVVVGKYLPTAVKKDGKWIPIDPGVLKPPRSDRAKKFTGDIPIEFVPLPGAIPSTGEGFPVPGDELTGSTGGTPSQYLDSTGSGSSNLLLVVVVVVAIGAGAWWFLKRKKAD